jgi:hypothetical protein
MQFDRSAVMRAAHRQWRYCRLKGWHAGLDDVWTWARCLRWAWAAAKMAEHNRNACNMNALALA